ncbi:MAG: DNA polymerase III subunit gamma/tau, partial [bacterium]|nr:DNA polymerase III subunit gamma/tau [bacterium]
MPVLYRKYRPQIFADVVGQAHITRTLSAAITNGRVAHAYLLAGPRGVGKTTTARLLAKAVNCESAKPQAASRKHKVIDVPCNACQTCTDITEGRCMDVVEIDAASHTGVDHVREHIVEAVRFAPIQAQRKVFIIDEVHMLSGGAFNALLKTIEEPPDHALFILATTEFHKVPETIRSRCQVFAFRRVAVADLTARLRHLAATEGVEAASGVFDAIARTADGSVRDAESMLGQLLALGGKAISAEDAALVLPRSSIERAGVLVSAIMRCEYQAALAEVRFAEEEGFDAEAYVRDVVTVLRNAIVAESGHAADIASRVTALRAFAGLLETIGRSDRPFFALEVAVLHCIASAPSTVSAAPRASVSAASRGDTIVRDALKRPAAPAPPLSAPPAASAAMGDDRALAQVRAVWG